MVTVLILEANQVVRKRRGEQKFVLERGILGGESSPCSYAAGERDCFGREANGIAGGCVVS